MAGSRGHTHVALERLLPGVRPRVLVQAALLAEGLAAFRALVRLLLVREEARNASEGRVILSKGHTAAFLPTSAGCGSTLRGAMNYYKFSGENRTTQNLLGSLKRPGGSQRQHQSHYLSFHAVLTAQREILQDCCDLTTW